MIVNSGVGGTMIHETLVNKLPFKVTRGIQIRNTNISSWFCGKSLFFCFNCNA